MEITSDGTILRDGAPAGTVALAQPGVWRATSTNGTIVRYAPSRLVAAEKLCDTISAYEQGTQP